MNTRRPYPVAAATFTSRRFPHSLFYAFDQRLTTSDQRQLPEPCCSSGTLLPEGIAPASGIAPHVRADLVPAPRAAAPAPAPRRVPHSLLAILYSLLAILSPLFLPSPAHAAANVFDMPSLHIRHTYLMELANEAHKQSNYTIMEEACREGIAIGSADELWHYNLACTLALQDKTAEALASLDQAIESGFLDREHASKDPDLVSLHDSEAFGTRISQMKALAESPSSKMLARRTVALAPDASQTVMQTTSNTFWGFDTALFHTLVDLPQTNPPTAFQGIEADAVNAWLRDGTAAGLAGVLYANRDNDAHAIDIACFPGLTRLDYAPEPKNRKLSIGLPNTLFFPPDSHRLIPVIGHSAMGYLNSPYWRSQPRAVSGDPRQAALQPLFLLGNQLHFYPTFSDYHLRSGDLFPANIPSLIAVAGSSGSERVFAEAALAALAAIRPETRAELARQGLLMPALNMLFRASQRTLASPRDYLTGTAHPVAFQMQHLDTSNLVHMAHALTTNDLPPLVFLTVKEEAPMVPGVDFFDIVPTEQLFDTPFAIARVFRGAERARTLEIEARCKRADAKLHWVILQGDPTKIALTPCPTNDALMTLTVAHHTPFDTPVGTNRTIRTARVDIGVIAETAATFSMPSIISFHFLANERRVYADDGRILSIDYTRLRTGYTDPTLSCQRNWKDIYDYDAQGQLTGWRRIRSLNEERFTAHGFRVTTTDALGRAATASAIQYIPRNVGRDNDSEAPLPDLAQIDDNITVAYRYVSDDDRVGEPDLSTLNAATPDHE